MAKQGGEMADAGLAPMVDSVISVLTNDGRILIGLLRGFDQATNLVLSDAKERVYSTKAGVESVPLGLYMIRGDTVAVIGLVDEEIEMAMDLSAINAAPLKPIRH